MTCFNRNKVSGSAAGVLIPAPKFRRGALCVEDEWTLVSMSQVVCRGQQVVLSFVRCWSCATEEEKLVKIEAQWRSPYR